MLAITGQKNHRILVIATNTWPYPGRVALALSTVGFQVAMISPASSPAHRLTKLGPGFVYHSWAPLMSIRKAIRAWSPTFLVCTDDVAVRALHRIHRNASKSGGSDSRELIDLIERSLGGEQTFETTEAKSRLISLAQSLDVACPKTTVIGDHRALQSEIGKIVFPVMVKADGSWGGRGVRLVNTRDELQSAISEFLFPANWPGPIRRFIGKVFPFFVLGWLRKWPRIMSLQQLIVGRPCNRAVVCWQGKVLAGISAEALETSSEFAPAAVVNIIDHPEITRAAEKIIAKLNLSGFIGFDFVIDHLNRAWLIEMNPRATPISHLNIMNGNLSAAIFTQLTGTDPTDEIPLVKERTIALFPDELLRSDHSVYTSSCYHDLPSDQPEFARACLRAGLKNNLRNLMGISRMLKLGQLKIPKKIL